MPKIPEIIPVSDLRQDAARVLNSVRSTNQPVVITQRGRASVVVMSLEAYERAEYERQLLLQLARGEREISKGVGHNLEQVLAEVDKLLSTGGA